jgi:hypothetical protein
LDLRHTQKLANQDVKLSSLALSLSLSLLLSGKQSAYVPLEAQASFTFTRKVIQQWYVFIPCVRTLSVVLDHKYANTLLLPQTKFPMRSNATEREPMLIMDVQKLYYNQAQRYRDSHLWITHDGPPYANGDLHMGHFMNKVLKDIINRYKVMREHRVSFIPGWDCHGLPIEIKALEKLQTTAGFGKFAVSNQEIRARARAFALEEVEKQKKAFISWGIMGDWAHPYLTLDPQYEATQLSIFYQMYQKGLRSGNTDSQPKTTKFL